MLSDDDLLDFDESRLAHYDRAEAERRLAEHGDVYRAQLVAARWIEGWRQRLEAHPIDHYGDDSRFRDGHSTALREVTAHLRQGDLIPGGTLYEEEMADSLHHPGERSER